MSDASIPKHDAIAHVAMVIDKWPGSYDFDDATAPRGWKWVQYDHFNLPELRREKLPGSVTHVDWYYATLKKKRKQ